MPHSSRWPTPALFILTLALVPAFAQSGRSHSAGKTAASAPVDTLTGDLRSISGAELVLDANDDRVVTVQIPSGVKYLSTMDKVKASDFEAGDHVTVEATRDDSDHYHATTITMNKKGTAEDKDNARQKAMEGTSEKPKAAPVQTASAPASVPASTSRSSGSSSSNSGNNSDSSGSDRPRLRRGGDGGDVASAAPASSSNGSASSAGSGSDSDSVPSSTVSGGGSRRSSVPSQSSSGPSTADDSGPPTLRRAPATSDSAPAAQNTPPGRPSLSAEDVNGVTRAPVIPPAPGVGPDGEVRGTGSDDDVIFQTRQVANSFTQTLPNYIVKQFTTRYRSDSASGGHTSWQAQDVVTADLVYLDGKENYLNVMANGRPTKDASQTGSWSEGEFASSLLALLSPFSATEFRNKRQVTIVNRPAYKYDYSIDQPHSAWRIQTEGQSYQPAYNGSIWIDKETFRVLRIEMAAHNTPRSFPVDTAESSLDYDFVLIGDQKYLLPVHSESLSCWRGTAQCARNVIDFRNYKKYTSDSSISFGDAVPDK